MPRDMANQKEARKMECGVERENFIPVMEDSGQKKNAKGFHALTKENQKLQNIAGRSPKPIWERK